MTDGTKVLITGGSGLLGRYLLRTTPDDYDVQATYCNNLVPGARWQMDIRQPAQIHKVFEFVRPDIVIHTAGNGSVDQCERDLEAGYGVNICGTYNVIYATRDCGAKFVYMSSNAVFDGKRGEYIEGDFMNPVNYYGHTKVVGEIAVQKFLSDWLIIRPIMLCGWPWPGGRSNWATRVVESLRVGKRMDVVCDVMTQPTYAGDCAEAIWKLLDENYTGIWHVGGRTPTSLCNYARTVADIFGLDDRLIHFADSSQFPDLAPRPRDPTYNIGKLLAIGIGMLSIYKGLQRMRDEELEFVSSNVHT